MICWFVEIVNIFFGLFVVWKFYLINKSLFDYLSNVVYIFVLGEGEKKIIIIIIEIVIIGSYG